MGTSNSMIAIANVTGGTFTTMPAKGEPGLHSDQLMGSRKREKGKDLIKKCTFRAHNQEFSNPETLPPVNQRQLSWKGKGASALNKHKSVPCHQSPNNLRDCALDDSVVAVSTAQYHTRPELTHGDGRDADGMQTLCHCKWGSQALFRRSWKQVP